MQMLLRRVKEGIRNGLYRQIVAGSLFVALTPLSLITPASYGLNSPTWQTELVIAEATPELMTKVDQPITIEKTVSRYEEAQKKKEEEAKRASQSSISYAQKLALADRAARAYGVPTQLLLAVWQAESGLAWLTGITSHAGAVGPFQFMPGTWRGYGVDGNGDGLREVHRAEDAAYGAARLLASNGAAHGDYERALLRYNNADWYVTKVLKLAGLSRN